MGQAMIHGMIQSEVLKADQISATALTDETIDYVAEEYGIEITNDNKKVAAESDILFLAVKPYIYQGVVSEIKSAVREETIVVTVAAGITLETMKNAFGFNVKVIRSMPNTPALVGAGMSVLSPNEYVTADDLAIVRELFESFGETEVVAEGLMDAVPAVSGSAPAFVYMFIEAMADGAVQQGMPRDKAYKLAAQTVHGAAKMVLETGRHPGELKDAVCTPAGTTIAGVTMLEQTGMRSSIIQAMNASTQRAKDLSSGKK